MTQPKHRSQAGTDNRWTWFLGEPLMLAMFALLPFVLAFVLSGGHVELVPVMLERIAAMAEPVLDRFYEAAAVIGALLVTLAAATAFGHARRSDFSERARTRILLAAAAGILLIAMMAAFTIPVAVFRPRRWAEIVVVLAVAWILLLAAQLIRFVVTPREKKSHAKKAWKGRRRRARERGVILESDESDPRVRRACEAAAWLVPVVLWCAVALFVTKIFVLGGPLNDNVLAVAIMAGYANLLITAGWRASADLSLSSPPRLAIRMSFMSVGVFASGVLGLALIGIETFGVLGAALLIFTALHVPGYSMPAWRSRLWWVRVVEEEATRVAINRLHSAYQSAKADPS